MPAAFRPAPSLAAAEGVDSYVDPDGFALIFPEGWVRAEGAASSGNAGQRRVVAFVNPSDPEENLSLVITKVSYEVRCGRVPVEMEAAILFWPYRPPTSSLQVL